MDKIKVMRDIIPKLARVEVMRKWLQSEYHMFLPEEVHNIIKEEVSDWTIVEDISLIIHRLSEMPWTTQKDLLDELNISKDRLRELNEVIYNNDFFQQLIVKEGLGRKYWNTMIPYIKNGVNEKVVNYEYQYPFRLALFPGLSCMYYCGFCGRNQNAKYKGDVMKEGNQRFKDIIFITS